MNKTIIDFLIRAKKATYAGGGPKSAPSRPNSHDLHYAEDNLKYIDTYLGGEKFAGEEALWDNDVPFWAMNYIGRIVADGFSSDFLNEALSIIPEDMPYRGPLKHENGDNVYTCSVQGDFEWFSGFEEIHNNGIKVYECIFHGGAIKW